MKIDEGFVHVAVRRFAKSQGWKLAAGQYPGGSDDECYALNITDPVLACDNSPDHRRHSDNKLVPDLFAIKGSKVLIVEMKPRYSAADEVKLIALIDERRLDLFIAMRKFGEERGIREFCEPEKLTLIPTLGFKAGISFPRNPRFAYFFVSSLDQVELQLPQDYTTHDATKGPANVVD